MPLESRSLTPDEAAYPDRVKHRLAGSAAPQLFVAGDVAALRRNHLGIICSVSCPGSVIIKTLDAVRAIRDAGVIVAGGFHSPMERECLHFLLRGQQPVLVCPAHGLEALVLSSDQQRAFDDGRLVLVSRFAAEIRHATPELARERNELVAALGEALFVPHAVPGGMAELAVRRGISQGQRVLALDDPANEYLFTLGATKLTIIGSTPDAITSAFLSEPGTASHPDRGWNQDS